METYDTIVIGLGAMGVAAAAHLASRGARVLGLEQFRIGHDRGSSHGESRLIRQAYFENPNYVPLLFRAYQLWDQLAAEANEELLVRSGLVVYGRPESSKVLRGVLESGRFYSIPVQELAREAAARRWPCYAPPEGFHAAFEPGAGFLRAEACTLAHAAKARRLGADLREGETMLAFDAQGGGVRVRTNLRTYEAAKLVVAGGGWSSNLLRDLGLPLELRRMLLAWFRADPLHIQAPGFIFDLEDDFYYGFPSTDGATIKIAGHHDFETMQDPAEKDLIAPSADRVARLEGFLAHCLPLARPGLVRAAHCIYTMTPDEDFVIDLHPEHPKICFAAGFSGHGFKFASVVGEVLADLSEGGTTKHPIGFLRADRFSSR